MTRKFIFIVGLPIWGSMYGEFMPHTIKVFKDRLKARQYKKENDDKHTFRSYTIIRRILN